MTRAYAAAAAAAASPRSTSPAGSPAPATSTSTSTAAASATPTSTRSATSGAAIFPMVPGHEIVGRVVARRRRGRAAARRRSRRRRLHRRLLPSARAADDLEQYCGEGAAPTYNSTEMDAGRPPTAATPSDRGGRAVRPQDRAGQALARAAPLLCAGITTYSPLRHWKAGKGSRVGVVGLGGLGHMAVKLAAALGAEVTMLCTSARRRTTPGASARTTSRATSASGVFRKLAGVSISSLTPCRRSTT